MINISKFKGINKTLFFCIKNLYFFHYNNKQILEDLQTEAANSTSVDVNLSLGQVIRNRKQQLTARMMGNSDVKDAMLFWMDQWEEMDSGGSLDQLSVPGIHGN